MDSTNTLGLLDEKLPYEMAIFSSQTASPKLRPTALVTERISDHCAPGRLILAAKTAFNGMYISPHLTYEVTKRSDLRNMRKG